MQMLNQTIQQIESLGIELNESNTLDLKLLMKTLIIDQHNETIDFCCNIISKQHSKDIGTLNTRGIDVGLRWAQHTIKKIKK
jgi:hypothetical protein